MPDATPLSVNEPRPLQKGLFITFEGIDGCGKTTHIRFLTETLENLGYSVLCLREPGGTVIGERLRELLLDKAQTRMEARTELLLFEAARAQIVSERIRPALAAGTLSSAIASRTRPWPTRVTGGASTSTLSGSSTLSPATVWSPT